MSWNQREAVEFATLLESHAPKFGFHVGLTGGCLYKQGERKDCDILLYRIRQEDGDLPGLLAQFESLGLSIYTGFGFCYKCGWNGKSVDLLVPEEVGNSYQDLEEEVSA